MTIGSDTTTDLEPTTLVRDDTFWRPDHDQAPQDWLGYLGPESDLEEFTIEDGTTDAVALRAVDPYEALAPPTDDLLPGR